MIPKTCFRTVTLFFGEHVRQRAVSIYSACAHPQPLLQKLSAQDMWTAQACTTGCHVLWLKVEYVES